MPAQRDRSWCVFAASAVIVAALIASIDRSATAQSSTTTVRLSPQDTFININTTSYGASDRLTTYTWPDNRVANAILMKVDLSGIPAGATIQQATLNLALVESDASADAAYTVTAHKLTR